MKKVLAALVILLVLFVVAVWFFVFRGRGSHNDGPKPAPLGVSKHSPDFNRSMNTILNAYYEMTEAFVKWDLAGVNKNAADLKIALEDTAIQELQKDTIIYETAVVFLDNSKTETTNILQQPAIEKKRESLNTLTDNLRTFFITVKYDQAKIYYQECPMAFGDNIPGYWLSPTDAVRNPYLGTQHPQYKDGMLECGGPKDTINFIQPDTTRH
jgi:hypothetical protein